MAQLKEIVAVLAFIALFLPVVALPLLGFGGLAIRLFRQGRWILGLIASSLVIELLFVLVLSIYLLAPGGTRVLDRVTLPDGTEVCLTQRWNGEPYEVRIWHREPNGQWNHALVNDAAFRLFGAALELDSATQRVAIRLNSEDFAIFDLATKKVAESAASGRYALLPAGEGVTPESWLAARAPSR